MPFQPRGGFPSVLRLAVANTGALNGGSTAPEQVIIRPPGPVTWFAVETDHPVRLFWNLDDFTNNANYMKVTTSFSGPFGFHKMWARSDDGTVANVQFVFAQKGGGGS